MSLDVNDTSATGDSDPRRFTIEITIEYSVVTYNAAMQVSLDPAHFWVVDEDTDAVYQAEAAVEPGDCSADHVVTKDGPAITCALHFLMPLSVGAPSQQSGGVHSKVRFEALGLHGYDFVSL